MLKGKTYVISLKHNNKRRRENALKQLTRFAIDFEWLDAVDGKTIDREYDNRLHAKGHWMGSGQLGCALSHMDCYKKIIHDNLDYGIILEDDFSIEIDFMNLISSMSDHCLVGSSVIFLYVNTYPNEKLVLKGISANLENQFKLYRIIEGRPTCTTGYLITKDAAKLMLNYQLPIQTVADDFDTFRKKGLIENYYLLYPRPVTISPFESQIQQSMARGRLQTLLFKALDIIGMKWLFLRSMTNKTVNQLSVEIQDD